MVHTLGYPLKQENYGGGFIYNMGRMLSIGLVVGLDYRDPYLDPHQEFQRFKTHPFISSMLKNAKMAHYGAKAIPEGGYYTMPRSYFDGGLLIGDSASLLNSQRLKGIHLAMKSGMLAAETLLGALLKDDFSERSLSTYEDKLLASWAGKELYGVRNFHQGFEHGLLPGLFIPGIQMATGGRGFRNRYDNEAGHARMKRLREYYNVWGTFQHYRRSGSISIESSPSISSPTSTTPVQTTTKTNLATWSYCRPDDLSYTLYRGIRKSLPAFLTRRLCMKWWILEKVKTSDFRLTHPTASTARLAT